MLYNSWFKRVFNLKRQEVKQFTQLTDSVGWISQGIMTLKEEEEITRKTETTRSKQTLPIADVFFVFVFNNSPRRLFSQIPPGTHGKDCQFVQAGKTCGIHCSVHFKSVRQQKTSQTVRTFPTYDRYLVACGRSQLAEETRPNNYVTNMNPRWNPAYLDNGIHECWPTRGRRSWRRRKSHLMFNSSCLINYVWKENLDN